ncbi:MAG: hypothetical protein WBC04_14905 [Candidatus Acidiferrales bacterium]
MAPMFVLAIVARSAGAQEIHPSVEPIVQHIQIPFAKPYEPAWSTAAPSKTISSAAGERRRFILLSSLTYGAAFLDMHESVSHRPNFEEYDPLAKPFVNLPAPAYYAIGAAITTGVNGLSWKMAHSERWHRVWWLPQAISVFGNSFCYGYTVKELAQPAIGRRRMRRRVSADARMSG